MDLDTPPPASPLPKEADPSSATDDDPDPIVSSYAVFTNPPPSTTRKILILQHPNKQGPRREPYQTLSEVRVKPSSGMIEVDVPVSYHDGSYDRDKGMRWGQALARSMQQKNGGSHGLAGGFGVGVPAPRAGRPRKEEDRDTYDWTEAVRRDQVLRTQTLGGQYAGRNSEFGDNECRWMVGVFKGGNLHLTPAQSEIQLRPQLHHLDATTEQDRLTRPRDGPGQGPGLAKDGSAIGAAAPAPKAITMTIKSSGSGDQPTTETMADRLRQVQVEHWQRLKYVEDDKDEAWELYQKTLIYRSPEFQQSAEDEAKGKGKAVALKPDEDEKDELKEKATRLQTRWNEDDYLRSVAGKDKEGVLEGYGNTALPGIKPEDVVEEVKKEDIDNKKTGTAAAAKGKGKAAMSVTASAASGSTAARRAPAAKGKAPAKGNAMQID
ncbi:DNA-directed RNA polymerase III complex subunit Rpc37 [Seiridium cupressi]